MRGRVTCFGLALAVILAGLALRLGPWRLPLSVHHYGGGVLWGMMLFALTAMLRPERCGEWACLIMAGAAAIGIESVRLIHTPGLDAFRQTLAGQLLLGHLFSLWNLVAYAVGLLVMALMVRPVVRWRVREPGAPRRVA